MPDKKTFNLRIITPSKQLYDGEADLMIMRTINGEMAVMAGHTPLTTILDLGLMKIVNGADVLRAAIFEGFAEITPNLVTILSDNAEWPEEIDTERAERALERAKERLLAKKEGIDIIRAENALKRAHTRLTLSTYRPRKNDAKDLSEN